MLAGRLQVLADGEEIHIGRAQVVHDLQDLLPLLAEADHQARLRDHGRIDLLHALQQAQRGEVARAGPDAQVKARHGLEVVVEDVGPRSHDRFDRARLAQEIGRQHLDRRLRRARADRADGLGEMLRTAILQIVTVDGGDDDVLEPEFRHGLGDVHRLLRIEGAGKSRGDVAERAGARADLAHDHHGGVPALPAFADIGAGGLLAHRGELVLAQDRLGLVVGRRMRGNAHTDPVRLAQDRRIRLVRLLGVARRLVVEQRDHASCPGARPVARAHPELALGTRQNQGDAAKLACRATLRARGARRRECGTAHTAAFPRAAGRTGWGRRRPA